MTESVLGRLTRALEGRYAIERELGEGGMATVYLAEDLKHHRKVAVKVLKPELTAVVGGERFLTEIETTAKLQHPNILPLFDSGQADGFLYYVMPFVDGESLRGRLERERQLPVTEAVRIATEVAEALQVAHEHGIVHRDIKPANIMVSRGRPLVADFGIALALTSAGSHRLTDTGLSVGTPQYMSPEQATGDQVVGPPSDVYSLGCVLYEMLVGEPPYTGKTAQAVLGRVITSIPESVTSHRRAVPPHVDAVVARALEKVPADRFSTAADFAKALADESFRHGIGSGARSAAPGWLRAAATVGWVSAVVLGLGWLISAREPEAAPETRRFSLAYGDETGPSEWLALTPDGTALITADRPRSEAGGPNGPGFNLFIHRFDDMSRTPIPGSRFGFDPAVSPDGRVVAFGGFESISVASLDGSPPSTLAEEGGCCMRWGADGYLYYSSIEPLGRIRRVGKAGGGGEQVLEPAEGEELGYFQPVGDGKRGVFVALHREEGRGTIEWVDLETGERTVITEGVRPYLVEDILVFGRGESVFGARLDLRSLQIVDGPVRVLEPVDPAELDGMYAMSVSGDLVYWTPVEDVEEVRELIWVGRDGTATSVDPEWLEQFESVDVSPDGTRAAVAVIRTDSLGWLDTEIWVKELDDGPQRRLTNYRGVNYRPVWSSDGASLAFISNRDGPTAVYSVPVDGIGAPQLVVSHPGKDIDEALWSSDGDWVIYRTGATDGDRDIYARRLRPDSATIVVSAVPDVDEKAPALSPNGRWLAYVSNEAGQEEIWVRPFPEVGLGSRRVSPGGRAVEPAWSDDGSELFFLLSGEGRVALQITDTDTFTTGELRVLHPQVAGRFFHTNYRFYAYDGRGDRFLMVRGAEREAEPSELILVQGFLDHVRATLGS